LRALSDRLQWCRRRRFATPLAPLCRSVAHLAAPGNHRAPTPARRRPSIAAPRLRLTSADRVLWAWLSHAWRGWRTAVQIVTPETVTTWHRRGFRLSGPGQAGSASDVRLCHTTFASLFARCPWRIPVGCPSDSRRAPEAGDRGESIDRGQIHATASAHRPKPGARF